MFGIKKSRGSGWAKHSQNNCHRKWRGAQACRMIMHAVDCVSVSQFIGSSRLTLHLFYPPSLTFSHLPCRLLQQLKKCWNHVYLSAISVHQIKWEALISWNLYCVFIHWMILSHQAAYSRVANAKSSESKQLFFPSTLNAFKINWLVVWHSIFSFLGDFFTSYTVNEILEFFTLSLRFFGKKDIKYFFE